MHLTLVTATRTRESLWTARNEHWIILTYQLQWCHMVINLVNTKHITLCTIYLIYKEDNWDTEKCYIIEEKLL